MHVTQTKKTKPEPEARGLRAEVIESPENFAALEEEWEDLHRNSPRSTPFQSWAWLYSWWEAYGEGYEPRIVAVRDGDLLVGIIPLMLERRLGFGRLLFIGSGASDCLDMLTREGREADVARLGAAVLARMDGWRVADLQELRPGGAARTLERSWSGPWTGSWQNNCPFTDLRLWEELVGGLSKNKRKVARRSLKRANEDGLRRELVGAEDAREAARRLVALHRESWEGRGIGLEHTTRRFERFQEAAAERMTARGLGAVSEFRRDNGETVVSTFVVFGRDFVGTYLNGASRQALKRYQFSTLCVFDALDLARRKGLTRLSHLRGEEAYKLRWASGVTPNHRLILGRNLMFMRAYASCQTLRSKAQEYLLSEDAPAWAAKAIATYRDLRMRGARWAERTAK